MLKFAASAWDDMLGGIRKYPDPAYPPGVKPRLPLCSSTFSEVQGSVAFLNVIYNNQDGFHAI